MKTVELKVDASRVDKAQSLEAPDPAYPEAGELRAAVGTDVDDALEGQTRIDLQIDWTSLDREALFASMKNYDEAENLYPKVPGQRHDTFVFHRATLRTQKGELLPIKFSKVISTYNGITQDELQIGISRPDLPQDSPLEHVASFDFLCNRQPNSEEWDMKHRKTAKLYRRQGIGDEVLKLAEEVLRKRAEDSHFSQAISAKSGQKDLTLWLENEKREFTPATAEDAANLERLKSKPNGLIEVTRFGETYTFDPVDFKAKFGDIVSGPEAPEVWEDYSSDKPYYYTKSCFKIKLKKGL